jgi:hypothetical protein
VPADEHRQQDDRAPHNCLIGTDGPGQSVTMNETDLREHLDWGYRKSETLAGAKSSLGGLPYFPNFFRSIADSDQAAAGSIIAAWAHGDDENQFVAVAIIDEFRLTSEPRWRCARYLPRAGRILRIDPDFRYQGRDLVGRKVGVVARPRLQPCNRHIERNSGAGLNLRHVSNRAGPCRNDRADW